MSTKALSEDFKLARRLNGIAVSDIVQIKQRAETLVREGRDVIDLSIGEPDFATPRHIQAAAVRAMRRGQTHYTATAGTLDLRRAIAGKLARDNSRDVPLGRIIVAVGAKQVLANALLATVESGQEVVIPAPCWSNYIDMVRVAGGVPVLVPCPSSAGFLMTPDQLERAIGPKTRWLLLNSPCNPTGACYTPEQLTGLASVLARYPHVGIVEDAIYEHILFDGRAYASILDVAPALESRTLWVNGVSKAYAMTGWRIGYGIGPQPLIDAMAVVSAQTTSHPCSIAQAAAVAALASDQTAVASFRATFERRRDLICAALSRVADLKLVKPTGAFYLFADISGVLERWGETSPSADWRLSAWLLENAGVAVVPGSAFATPGHFRLSFAASEARLSEAGERLVAAFAAMTATDLTDRTS